MSYLNMSNYDKKIRGQRSRTLRPREGVDEEGAFSGDRIREKEGGKDQAPQGVRR